MITSYSKETLLFQPLLCYLAEDTGEGCSPVTVAEHSGVLNSPGHSLGGGSLENVPGVVGKLP